jgi:hypothetical protein
MGVKGRVLVPDEGELDGDDGASREGKAPGFREEDMGVDDLEAHEREDGC